VNYQSQRDMVAASLLVDEQRQHRHDAPARLALARRGVAPAPNRCRVCGRRWGATDSDRRIDGSSGWHGDICPVCDWDTAPPVHVVKNAPRAA
jgi:hypothetical protein